MTVKTDARSLLFVDDDEVFRRVMGQALSRRGFEVVEAEDVDSGRTEASRVSFDYAVIDLKMPGESGLHLVRELVAASRDIRIVVLTGYASIPTAVEAIKLGAVYYLAKPADADDVVRAFARTDAEADIVIPANPMSVDRIEWEHIQKVLDEHDGNISATARALNMHRRTLQRKLQKRPKRY